MAAVDGRDRWDSVRSTYLGILPYPMVVATLVPALVTIPQIPSIPLILSSRNEGVAVWEGLGLPSPLFISAIGLTLRKRGLLYYRVRQPQVWYDNIRV